MIILYDRVAGEKYPRSCQINEKSCPGLKNRCQKYWYWDRKKEIEERRKINKKQVLVL